MYVRPEITTIIPTFRRPKLLKRAIQSVLNQTYPHFRVWIYDNASGDETAEIVADFIKKDSRVNYYCHCENIGSIANFNYGISKVETEYFSLLSDDDVLLPNFYQTTLDGFEKYPAAMISAGEVIEMNEEREFVRARMSLWPRDGIYEPPEGLAEMFGKEPVWTGILFRKDVIHEIGLLDWEVGLPCDLDFELRIASLFPICISKHPCAILVDHSSSLSTNAKLGSYWVGWLRMIDKLMESEQIPLAVRVKGDQILRNQLIRIMFRTRAVIRGDYEDSYKTAEVLRTQLNQKKKAVILSIMIGIIKHFPPIFNLNKVIRQKIRTIRSIIQVRKLPYSIDDYFRYLDY